MKSRPAMSLHAVVIHRAAPATRADRVLAEGKAHGLGLATSPSQIRIDEHPEIPSVASHCSIQILWNWCWFMDVRSWGLEETGSPATRLLEERRLARCRAAGEQLLEPRHEPGLPGV